MHIPDGMMSGAVCPLSAGLALAGLGGATLAAVRAEARPSPKRFAAVAALVFAGQMMNFPVDGGTSGHLLGGVLAAGLLGVPAGILAVGLVVLAQCLVFGDGGVSALGMNLLTMALVGAGAGGWLLARLRGRAPLCGVRGLAASAVAAWGSVVLAAATVAVALGACGAAPLGPALAAMLPVHAVIGLGEALLTVAALAVFAREPETESADAWRAPAATAGVIALLFSPWASALPDGLERVAAGGGFLPGVEAFWRGPLPEYAIPGLPGAALATGLAGLLGATLVFAGGLLLARALAARAEAAIARKGIS